MRLTPGHGTIEDELRTEGIRVVVARHAPALWIPVHAHDVAKLVLVLEGAGSERCGLELERQTPMSLRVRPPFQLHQNQYHAEGARSVLVELDPSDRRVRAAVDPAPLGARIARRLGLLLSSALAAPASARKRRIREFVNRSLATLEEARRRPSTPAWLDRARVMLIERMDAPPSLGELACTVGVHPVHLAQSFRARWGITTRRFLRAHRVFEALELVQQGVGFAEAAAQVGFADQSHMTRAIRLERGAPPGQLRRRARQP
jgi:AraC family transcriptional regulator